MVYVIDSHGNPLMPTQRLGKVHRWLKQGQAIVVASSKQELLSAEIHLRTDVSTKLTERRMYRRNRRNRLRYREPYSFAKLIDSKTKALFCESIGNSLGNVVDLSALAELAHAHGLPLIVDNTVPTPYLCRP
ncbi:MAG: hypothetical protein BWK79_07715, partial [Beggiatoa sp. IS2]